MSYVSIILRPLLTIPAVQLEWSLVAIASGLMLLAAG
jgi:hypothetical protein